MKVAVVGSGIHGASSAMALAQRGHDVTLFEQFSIGHAQGSSHGESRIVRKAYPDKFYTGLMAEAYPLWRDLEKLSGETFLHEVGLTYFGPSASENLQTVISGLTEVGEPFEILDATSIATVSPQMRLGQDEIAVFTKAAGWVDAARAVAATLTLAERFGAKIQPGQRAEKLFLKRNFDAFVVAPGAWIRGWVTGLNIAISLQTVGFFDAAIAGPVWIEDSEMLAYGFPAIPGLGAKIAYHTHGRRADPTSNDRSPDTELIDGLRDVLARRFGVQEAPLVRAYACLYTNTPDEDFRLGTIGENGFYISACSGHGFKFAPWIGRLMADFVEGKRTPEEFPRFLGNSG